MRFTWTSNIAIGSTRTPVLSAITRAKRLLLARFTLMNCSREGAYSAGPIPAAGTGGQAVHQPWTQRAWGGLEKFILCRVPGFLGKLRAKLFLDIDAPGGPSEALRGDDRVNLPQFVFAVFRNFTSCGLP
jgi:hypothetical protein